MSSSSITVDGAFQEGPRRGTVSRGRAAAEISPVRDFLEAEDYIYVWAPWRHV